MHLLRYESILKDAQTKKLVKQIDDTVLKLGPSLPKIADIVSFPADNLAVTEVVPERPDGLILVPVEF